MIKELEKQIKQSRSITTFLKKLNNNEAEQSDVSLYAADLGECVGIIINRNIRKGMNFDELENLALPLFKDVQEKVSNAAIKVQKREDEENHVGINPIVPDFPYYKIHDLIYKIYEELRQVE